MGLARLTQAATNKTVFVNPDDVLDVHAILGGTQINMSQGECCPHCDQNSSRHNPARLRSRPLT